MRLCRRASKSALGPSASSSAPATRRDPWPRWCRAICHPRKPCMSNSSRAVVLLPTYNEVDNLPRIVPAILAAAPVDLMVLDDNSPDGTGRLAGELAAKEPRIQVVHRASKQGLGAAYIDG